MDPNNTGELGIRKEIFRKLIHILGFLVIIISLIWGIFVATGFVAALGVIYSISEYLRLRGHTIPFVTTITKKAMRNDTKENRNRFIPAPVLLAVGVLSALLIFPNPLNYAAIAVLTLGDSAAALIGMRYGKRRIPFSPLKTVEGTAAGLICSFIGASFFVPPIVALTGASVGMIAEYLPLRTSDNISVPLLAGLSMIIITQIL